MKEKLYIAYGSNMSIEQMRYRCPEAELIGHAKLKDYELLFKGSKTGSYATIEPAKGKGVPALIWIISEQDERNLDRYEGYPTFYYKKELEVDILAMSNESPPPHLGKHKAMVYIMDERRKLGSPSIEYYELIAEAYSRFGFDHEILAEALKKSAPQKEHA